MKSFAVTMLVILILNCVARTIYLGTPGSHPRKVTRHLDAVTLALEFVFVMWGFAVLS